MTSKTINDKNATITQYLHQNTKLEAITCQRDSQRVTRTTSGPSSSRQVEVGGRSSSGRRVAFEILQDLHLNADCEMFIRKFNDFAKNFVPQSEEDREFTTKCWTTHVQDEKNILVVSKIRSYVAMWGHCTATDGFILACKGF